MSTHPVQLFVTRPARVSRFHVLTSAVLLIAFGMVASGSLYWFLYLALPAVAAIVVNQKGGRHTLDEHGPAAVRVLRWLAGAYAYLWLLTERLPGQHEGESAVELRVELGPPPTPTSALARLISSLPALLLLAVLSIAGTLLWVVGAVWILIAERVPGPIADFLELTLRFQFRVVAYHMSLVERYPSLEPSSTAHSTPASATPSPAA